MWIFIFIPFNTSFKYKYTCVPNQQDYTIQICTLYICISYQNSGNAAENLRNCFYFTSWYSRVLPCSIMFYLWLIDEAGISESKGTKDHLIFSSMSLFSAQTQRSSKSKEEYDRAPWLFRFLRLRLPCFSVLSHGSNRKCGLPQPCTQLQT